MNLYFGNVASIFSTILIVVTLLEMIFYILSTAIIVKTLMIEISRWVM